MSKVKKKIALIKKFQHILARHSLLTIYKTFVGPHLDHGDAVHDKMFYESFHKKLASLRHNSTLAMTGSIRETNSEKLCQELGLQRLK